MDKLVNIRDISMIILGIVVVIIMIRGGFFKQVSAPEGFISKKVSGDEARKILSEKKNALILDVRTKPEYDEKHIDKAKLIPLQVLKNEVEKEIPKKDTPLIIYCRTGIRSADAIRILQKMGYSELYDLGGITSW